MSVTEELIEAVKAALLPELAELKQGLTDLKQGLAELRADLKFTNSRLELLEERYDDLRDQINQRFDQVERRFGEMDKRFDDMKTDIGRRFLTLENGQAELKRDIAEVRSYVWTTGLEQMAGRKKASAKVREKGVSYAKKEKKS